MTDSINLPVSFIVTLSRAGSAVKQATATDNEFLTASELAIILKCKPSSVYNLTPGVGQTDTASHPRHQVAVRTAAQEVISIEMARGARDVRRAGRDRKTRIQNRAIELLLRYTRSVQNELSLIAAFVKRNKRDRYREILSSERLRHKFTSQLAHFTDFPR